MVEAVGPKAKGVKPGQKRIVYPWIGCGKCAVCKAGQDNYCVSGIRFLGVSRPGAYSTHLLVPIPSIWWMPRASTARSPRRWPARASPRMRAAKLPEIGPVNAAVLGCGGLGLIGVSVLRARA